MYYPSRLVVRWFSFVCVCLCAGILLSCAGTPKRTSSDLGLMPYRAPMAVSSVSIPYPIILIHGLGQKAAVWDAGINPSAVRYYQQDLGLQYGGLLHTVGGVPTLTPPASKSSSADFFTVQFNYVADSVGAWKNELYHYVRLVRERTGADKVILIGYSMGGLAARYYAVATQPEHHVQRLITIGTPHLGSPYARVYKWKTAINEALKKDPNFASKFILEQGKALFESAEKGVPADAPAVRDLLRPEDGGDFLQRLGWAQHPGDIEYISVVGKVEMLNELSQLSSTATKELLRRLLGVIGFGAESLFEGGDGVVSERSQTLNEIPWFKQNAARRRISRVVTIPSVHEDHLRFSNEIQRITLEDKTELRGVEFYENNGKPVMVIECTDNLPASQLQIECRFRLQGAVEKIVRIAPASIRVVRGAGGAIVYHVAVDFPADTDYTKAGEIQIRITNTFNNVLDISRTWRGTGGE